VHGTRTNWDAKEIGVDEDLRAVGGEGCCGQRQTTWPSGNMPPEFAWRMVTPCGPEVKSQLPRNVNHALPVYRATL
jgi:hypothetical protein